VHGLRDKDMSYIRLSLNIGIDVFEKCFLSPSSRFNLTREGSKIYLKYPSLLM